MSYDEAVAAVAEEVKLSEERVRAICRKLDRKTRTMIRADEAMKLMNAGIVGPPLKKSEIRQRREAARRWKTELLLKEKLGIQAREDLALQFAKNRRRAAVFAATKAESREKAARIRAREAVAIVKQVVKGLAPDEGAEIETRLADYFLQS
jgi:hypothetical protein